MASCCLVVLLAATNAFADAEAAPDAVGGEEVRELLELGLANRDTWYTRGFDSLFARDQSGHDSAARGDPIRIDKAFLPYAGLRIRQIHILGREAFGTLVVDSTATMVEEPEDVIEIRTGALAGVLNVVTTRTGKEVIRSFLLFEEGEVIDPFAFADSERMLRQQPYTSDTKIEVLPLVDQPGWADVAVLVRDRFPLGFKAKIHTRDRYNLEVFHRNVAGLGLNLEYEVPVERGKAPTVGHRFRASITNIFGSFMDLSVQTRQDWSRDEDYFIANRDFVHPNIRLVGGLGLFHAVDKNNPRLPEGTYLETRTIDPWLGWGIRLRDGDQLGRRRKRLIPAVRMESVDFRQPPRRFASAENDWRDWRRFLGQITLLGVDYYTTSLVNSYGETEDIPSGTWMALVGGWETSELYERGYSGFRFVLPRFTELENYLAAGVDLGGFWRNGRFEDGVFNVVVGGFSSLKRRSIGSWRHFLVAEYTLGINRTRANTLRLDEFALRDLDTDEVVGDQRLTLGYEGVLFTRLAILGFRVAAFGYADGGFVGGARSNLINERFSLNAGVGLRLNNPRLVIPTMELRLGLLSTPAGTEPALTFRMGDVKLLRREVPSAVPQTLPYR